MWFEPKRRGAVEAQSFRPSSDEFGTTVGTVIRCRRCGHGSVVRGVDTTALREAYGDAEDTVSLREEQGQVETARRALVRIEAHGRVGTLLDVGCWTGSFLVAARERGWSGRGVEPSGWAAARARARGLDVVDGHFEDLRIEPASLDLAAACDVVEHLADPAGALRAMAAALRDGGLLYLTVPDAGSLVARALGRRWWSVMPMHIQYFTRASMEAMLAGAGFTVVETATHPKAFTARYYAERLAAFSPPLGRAGMRVAEGLRVADRVVAPDLRDRLAVIARRR